MKKIILVVAIIAAMFLVVSFIMPSAYKVERSIIIQSPVELIYNEIFDYSNMMHWSPWKDYDPHMQTRIESEPGKPGYKYSWSSAHEKAGKGSLTRMSALENTRVEDELMFEDFGMRSKSYWLLEDTGKGIKVTWGNTGRIGLLWRIPMSLINMEKTMAPDFEKGLGRLKVYCENKQKELVQDPEGFDMPMDSTFSLSK